MRFPFQATPRRSPASTILALVSLVSSLALVGCSSDNPAGPGGGGGGGSTTYKGTYSGNGLSGTLTLTIATTNPVPQPGPARARAEINATGTLTPSGGAAVSLTGIYDDVNDTINLAGGGWTATGGRNGVIMEGVVGGPGGVSGFYTCPQAGSGSDSVLVVTGNFTSTTGGPGGVFNFSIRGTVLTGNAVETGGNTPIPLDGTYTPGTGAISIVNPGNPSGPPLATGTLASNGQASGNYDDGAGEAGTWAGTKQN